MVAALMAVPLAPVQAADCQPGRTPPTLTVSVTGARAARVPGAKVHVYQRGGKWAADGETDADGTARFSPPRAGEYGVLVTCAAPPCGDRARTESKVLLVTGSSTSLLLMTESTVIY